MLLAVARACLETGQSGDAFLYLRAAENSASHRGEVRRLMGLAHLKAGDVEQAVEELMAAVRACPEDTELKGALDEALRRFTTPISVSEPDAGQQPTQAAAQPPKKKVELRSHERRVPSQPILLHRGRSKLPRERSRRATRLTLLVFALLVTGALALTLRVPRSIEGGDQRLPRAVATARTEPAPTSSPSRPLVDETSSEAVHSQEAASPDADDASQPSRGDGAYLLEARAPTPAPSVEARTPTPTPGLSKAPTRSQKPSAGEATGQTLAGAPEAVPAPSAELAVKPQVADAPAPLSSRAGEAYQSLAEPLVAPADPAARSAPVAPVLIGTTDRGLEKTHTEPSLEGAPDSGLEAPDPVLETLRGKPRIARMDSPPNLKTPLRIPYTAELARQGARGRAVFWVLVSGSGRVEDVRLLQSSGSAELDTAATDAIRESSYTPARHQGKPLPAWTQQQIVGLCCRSAPTP